MAKITQLRGFEILDSPGNSMTSAATRSMRDAPHFRHCAVPLRSAGFGGVRCTDSCSSDALHRCTVPSVVNQATCRMRARSADATVRALAEATSKPRNTVRQENDRGFH